MGLVIWRHSCAACLLKSWGCRIPALRLAAHRELGTWQGRRGHCSAVTQLEQSKALKLATSSRHMDRQQAWSSHHLLWQCGCP